MGEPRHDVAEQIRHLAREIERFVKLSGVKDQECEAILGMAAGILGLLALRAAPPRGEPSEEQLNAAARAMADHTGVSGGGFAEAHDTNMRTYRFLLPFALEAIREDYIATHHFWQGDETHPSQRIRVERDADVHMELVADALRSATPDGEAP